MAGECRCLCKEEVQKQFPVLAVELWEERVNTHVLLSVLGDGREKARDSLHTVALLSRKRRKKKEKSSRRV